MSPHSFWGYINPFRLIRGGPAIGGIHPLERFREILDRERARTDRTGARFCLVVFKLAGRKRDTYHTLYHITKLVMSRVRASDEVGWFDKTAIGAILVGAGNDGAERFVSAILGSLPKDLATPTVEVYVYPVPGAEGPEKNMADALGTESPEAAARRVPIGEPAKAVAEAADVKPLPPVFVRQLPLWKDILDVVLAVVALALLSPLFLVIAAYIKIVSPGPVFFRQERVGFRGRKFMMLKFRTMKVDNNPSAHEEYLKQLIKSDQAMVKLDEKKDPRIIPLGGLLRQTGLDELPQLINVVKGDMSLVGPRPCLPYEAREYDRWHAKRFDSIPGLTGLWQVSGKNRTTFKEMVQYDIKYARRMTPWMELQILFRTFPAIFQQIKDHRVKSRAGKETIPSEEGKEKP